MTTLVGTPAPDLIFGTRYSDLIFGYGGDDVIHGGDAADVLWGGAGHDTLFGDAGDDVFQCTVFSGGDLIDGGQGFDIVEFSNRGWQDYTSRFSIRSVTYFAASGTVVFGDDLYVLRNVERVLGTGNPDIMSTLSFAGATGRVSVNLGTGLVVGSSRGLTDVERFDIVIGGSGNDRIVGDAKENVLVGGEGSDTLDGGERGDTFFVAAGDVVFDSGRTGTDTIVTTSDWKLANDAENLVLTGAARTGVGNEKANLLISGDGPAELRSNGGNDVLWGRSSADRLDGGAGNDILRGGGGNDTYVWRLGDGHDVIDDSSGAADRLSLLGLSRRDIAAVSAFDTADAGTCLDALAIDLVDGGQILIHDFFDNSSTTLARSGAGAGAIESVILTRSGEVLNFGAIRSMAAQARPRSVGTADLVPVADVTVLRGTSAADVIVGTAAAEQIVGGGGDDVLRGQVGNDVLLGGDGNDILQGGQGQDTLLGGDGADNLSGEAGADVLAGGSGNDTYVVDGLDTLVEFAGEGFDTVVTSESYVLGDALEGLRLTGAAPVNGTGNELGNLLYGNDAGNVLLGLDGADTLVGFDGADTLYGGAGADVFRYWNKTHSAAVAGCFDTIADFSVAQGDKLDLRQVDGNDELAKFQRLVLINGSHFTGAGQVRVVSSGGNTLVYGNTDSDSTPEFLVKIIGVQNMSGSILV